MKFLRKAALLSLIAAGLGWLFLQTIRQTNAEPYTIDGEDVSGWTLALEDPEFGGHGILVLQPPVGLPAELFRQIFLRSGLSMAGPARPSMPIVLRSDTGRRPRRFFRQLRCWKRRVRQASNVSGSNRGAWS